MSWSDTPAFPAAAGTWSPSPDFPESVAAWTPMVERGGSADTGIGGDTAVLGAFVGVTDLAAALDHGRLAVDLIGADSGAGLDHAAGLIVASGSDLGTGLDLGSALFAVSGADTGAGLDSGALFSAVTGADGSTGSDSAGLSPVVTGGDTGVGSAIGTAKYLNSWSGSRAATAIAQNTWTDLLTFTTSGLVGATCTFTVVHSWGSSVLQWLSVDRAIRVFVNSVEAGFQNQAHTTGSWSSTMTLTGIAVPAGALVRIEAYAESGYSGPRTVTVSSASMTITGV